MATDGRSQYVKHRTGSGKFAEYARKRQVIQRFVDQANQAEKP
jgi:hypothetical protein